MNDTNGRKKEDGAQASSQLEMLHRISRAMVHQHNVAAMLDEVLDIME